MREGSEEKISVSLVSNKKRIKKLSLGRNHARVKRNRVQQEEEVLSVQPE